ncbi:MAG: hypothetical protein J6M05_06275 [Cardiobacteriaceae bacterium]|nr:hypothetical protein [Cardiobacteriaceae bacterium]
MNNKKTIIAVFFLIAICVIFLFLPKSTTAEQGEKIWKDGSMRGSARFNDFYVLKKYLAKHGITMRQKSSIIPNDLSQNEAIILANKNISHNEFLDKNKIDFSNLEKWIKNGGHLILLDYLPKAALDLAELEEKDFQIVEIKDDFLHYQNLNISNDNKSKSLLIPNDKISNKFIRRGEQKDYLFLFSIKIGKGIITFSQTDANIFSNSAKKIANQKFEYEDINIAKADNAAFFLKLLADEEANIAKPKTIQLISLKQIQHKTEAENKFSDLRKNIIIFAPLMLILFILAYLLTSRYGRRFGSLEINSNKSKQDFHNHLIAAGKYWSYTRTAMPYFHLFKHSKLRLEEDLKSNNKKSTILPDTPKTEQEFHLFMQEIEKIRKNNSL